MTAPSETESPQYTDVFNYTMHLLGLTPGEMPQNPPPRFFPKSFDETYAVRESLAAFEISIGRDPEVEAQYQSFLTTLESPEQAILDKYFSDKRLGERDARFTFAPSDFPLLLPQPSVEHDGVEDVLFWYLDDNMPLSWIADKIVDFIAGKGLTSKDFVAYRKLQAPKIPFIPGFSRTVLLPHVRLLIRSKLE